MDTTAQRELLAILDELLSHLRRPDSDVSWSTFRTADAAVKEVEKLKGQIKFGNPAAVGQLMFMFLPTGSLQEVSLSSGWGKDFVALAERFDAVAPRFAKTAYDISWKHALVLALAIALGFAIIYLSQQL